MPRSAQTSPALPIAHVALRILIVLNWVAFALVAVLLLAMPTREWILRAFDLSPSLEADRVVMGLRLIAGVGLVTFPINYVIFKRLAAMVETVRVGDPFVATNAQRLRVIAWSLLVLQVLGMIIAALAKTISTPDHPVNLNAGFSTNGWLAVLLTFLLARVFAEGTRMRDDLEGTV